MQIIHAVLRVMLAEAVRDELVERNVADHGPGAGGGHARRSDRGVQTRQISFSQRQRRSTSRVVCCRGALLAFAGESSSASVGQT